MHRTCHITDAVLGQLMRGASHRLRLLPVVVRQNWAVGQYVPNGSVTNAHKRPHLHHLRSPRRPYLGAQWRSRGTRPAPQRLAHRELIPCVNPSCLVVCFSILLPGYIPHLITLFDIQNCRCNGSVNIDQRSLGLFRSSLPVLSRSPVVGHDQRALRRSSRCSLVCHRQFSSTHRISIDLDNGSFR